ncbi:hypothetical protein DMJ13_10040 [halophilic archaeon]|nr:hypothetical protein DMJ13_10040 [halophilic archaeon]
MSDTESNTTTDHDEIRNWVEERGGHPAHVEGTGEGDDPGLLRIDFEDADGGEESLEEISWDEFFDAFEENDLALVYQEETEGGDESRFSKLVSRDEA